MKQKAKRLIKNQDIEDKPIVKEQISDEEEVQVEKHEKHQRFQVVNERENINYFLKPGAAIADVKVKKKEQQVFKMDEDEQEEPQTKPSFFDSYLDPNPDSSMEVENDSDSLDLPFENQVCRTLEYSTRKESPTKKTESIKKEIKQELKQEQSPIQPYQLIEEADSNHILSSIKQMKVQEESINVDGALHGKMFFILGEFNLGGRSRIEGIIKANKGNITASLRPHAIVIKGDYYQIKKNDKIEIKQIHENQKLQEAQRLNYHIMDTAQFSDWLRQQTGGDLHRHLSLPTLQMLEITPSKKKEIQEMILLEPAEAPKLVHIPQTISKTKQVEKIGPEVEKKKNVLWTQKYAPARLSDLFDSEYWQGVVTWLKDWGKEKQQWEQTKFSKSNLSAKAVLLSGPPGVGKTTTIRLIAAQMGYQLLEWNASDVRSKKQIDQYVKHLQDNSVLKFNSGELVKDEKTMILMDEVDGMQGSDKGGSRSLLDMIKLTKVPIVCICNDRQSQKMRSLATYCYDVQVKPPNPERLLHKLEAICKEEHISYQKKELEAQINICQSDVRQLLNLLQMHKNGFKQAFGTQGKDTAVTTNNFEATKLLLTYSKTHEMNIHSLIDYAFIDSSMISAMFQENYLDLKEKTRSMQYVAQAANSLAESDILQTKIMRNQEWALMPNAAFLAVVYPTQVIKGNLPGKVNFPAQLGKISSENKTKRQLLEIKQSFAQNTYTATGKAIKNDYIEPFAFLVIQSLISGGITAIDSTIQLLKQYNQSPASFEETIVSSLCLFPKREVYQMVPANVRNQLAKEYREQLDSTFKLEGGGARRQQQNTTTRNTKYNEFEDAVEQDDDLEEEEQKPVKKVAPVKTQKGKGRGNAKKK